MDTPTDRTPTPEPITIPVLVQPERPKPQKCSDCEEAIFGFHRHSPSTTFAFHLTWWNLWMICIAVSGLVAALAHGKTF